VGHHCPFCTNQTSFRLARHLPVQPYASLSLSPTIHLICLPTYHNLSIHPSTQPSVHPSIHLSLSLYIHIYTYIYLFIYLCIDSSISLSINLVFRPSLCLPTDLSVCPFIYLPLHGFPFSGFLDLVCRHWLAYLDERSGRRKISNDNGSNKQK
jgi:hypothetical protein